MPYCWISGHEQPRAAFALRQAMKPHTDYERQGPAPRLPPRFSKRPRILHLAKLRLIQLGAADA
eukprot:SAG11_NODE_10949_length_794_cov_0.739568_1_plen_64_part_00